MSECKTDTAAITSAAIDARRQTSGRAKTSTADGPKKAAGFAKK
jgi:hypothetical protein